MKQIKLSYFLNYNQNACFCTGFLWNVKNKKFADRLKLKDWITFKVLYSQLSFIKAGAINWIINKF